MSGFLPDTDCLILVLVFLEGTKIDCVCFDVDSTVCIDEGLDELAEYCGIGDKIKLITSQAMSGGMDFEEALERRLTILQPTRATLESFTANSSVRLTPGVTDVVQRLRESDVAVYLLSGGFVDIINPVADALSLPRSCIVANSFVFQPSGAYDDFDRSLCTARSGGKAAAVRQLRSRHGYTGILMVGDGSTDREACPPADGFVGFGGNVVRDAVRSVSRHFVYSMSELAVLLGLHGRS